VTAIRTAISRIARPFRSWYRRHVMHNSRSLIRSINGRQRNAWQGLRR